MQKKSDRKVLICKVLFAVYLMFAAYLLLFKNMGKTYGLTYLEYLHSSSNFIPFFFLYNFVTMPVKPKIIVIRFVTNVIGNLLLLLPWGVLAPICIPKLRDKKRFLLVTLLGIVVIEMIQVFGMLGIVTT